MCLFATGNWERDTQESRYSAKVPIAAIRCMSGFELDEGYFLPRGNVAVPTELEELMWPWIESAEDYILGFSENLTEHPTAMEFLRLMHFLRRVFIQDSAAMLSGKAKVSDANHCRRISHDIFKRFPLFSDTRFIEYTSTMGTHLEESSRTNNDPTNKQMEKCLPGISKRFDIVENHLSKLDIGMEEINTRMEGNHHDSCRTIEDLEQRITETSKKQQLALVSSLSSFFRRGISERVEDLDTHARLNSNSTEHRGTPLNSNHSNFATPQMDDRSTPVVPVTDSPPNPLTPPETQQTTIIATPQTQQTTPQTQPTTPTTTDAANSTPNAPNDFESISNKILSFRYIGNSQSLCLSDCYKEFFGLGRWANIPIPGGFYGLEQIHKSKWRPSYSPAERNFFSRAQALLKAVCDQTNTEYGLWNATIKQQIQDWDPIVKSKGITGALRYLQKEGTIATKGKRNRDKP